MMLGNTEEGFINNVKKPTNTHPLHLQNFVGKNFAGEMKSMIYKEYLFALPLQFPCLPSDGTF